MALTYTRSNRRPRLSGEQTKEALLNHAASEIAEAGAPLDLVDFSMEDIIDGAGVSRSAAYTLFGGLAGFRQAVIQRIAQADPYSQEALDTVIGEVVEAAEQGSIERATAVARVGHGLATVAFSSVALSLERIVELRDSDKIPFYVEAAQAFHQRQTTLHNRLSLHLPALHFPYGETPINKQTYTHDFLAVARGHAVSPLSDAASQAAFNAIADVHVSR